MLRVGTRGSKLALTQTYDVVRKLESLGMQCEIVQIKTTGDLIVDRPLVDIGGKALFLKEIEESLLAERIDIAVHSLKDVPAELPNGLMLAAVTHRCCPRDVLISDYKLSELKTGSVIGTCSSRRKAFLRHTFGNRFHLVDMRGNIDTRISKFQSGEVNAIILANSGIERLKMTHCISEIISTDIILPAVGQGAVAVECRENDSKILQILQKINHLESYICTAAERGFMIEMKGNCKTPIAALAKLENDVIKLRAAFAVPTGEKVFYAYVEGKENPHDLGVRAAHIIQNDIRNSDYFELVKDLFIIE